MMRVDFISDNVQVCVLLRPKEPLVYTHTHTLLAPATWFFVFLFIWFCAALTFGRRSRARALLPAAADDRVPLAERPPPTWRKTRKQEPATRRRKGRDEYKLKGPRHLKFSWLHDAGWKLSTFSLCVSLHFLYKLLERLQFNKRTWFHSHILKGETADKKKKKKTFKNLCQCVCLCVCVLCSWLRFQCVSVCVCHQSSISKKRETTCSAPKLGSFQSTRGRACWSPWHNQQAQGAWDV